jgi:hypothetical protein
MSPALIDMQSKRLLDAADGHGYGVPAGVMTPGGRSPQLYGTEHPFKGKPHGALAMLACYKVGDDIYMQRGFVEGTPVSGTGKINLSEGDDVYLVVSLVRQKALWFTHPYTNQKFEYLTGRYSISAANIVILPGGSDPPATENGLTRYTNYDLLFTATNIASPDFHTLGRWRSIARVDLTF